MSKIGNAFKKEKPLSDSLPQEIRHWKILCAL